MNLALLPDTTKHQPAEREGFEPPGLVGLPLSRRVHLSALPPFRQSRLSTRPRRGSVRNTAVVDRGALIERISRTWALNAAAHARVLAGQDPSWGTDVFELAGGWAVLCGPGLYVNRALAWGLAEPVTGEDFDVLEERSAAVGVAPSVDVVPTADRSITELAAARGYGIMRFLTTHVLSPTADLGDLATDPVDRDRACRRRAARLRGGTWPRRASASATASVAGRAMPSPRLRRPSTRAVSCSPATAATAVRSVAQASRSETGWRRSAG